MERKSSFIIALGISTALVSPAIGQEALAKNVILMISDGAGIGTWKAASYYRNGALGHEVYDDFDVKLHVSTYPLTTAKEPTKSDEDAINFDQSKLWSEKEDDTVYEGFLGTYPAHFEGYDYARNNYTDSAAAGNAIATGQKTYAGAIGWSNDGTQLKNIGEYAVESGRSLGSISSVEWSHATPISFLAHNPSRDNYAELAQEVVNSGRATVVMGAGNPYFDEAGLAVAEPEDEDFRYVGGREMWDKLRKGETDYKLIETKADFEALANGELDLGAKTKLIGTAQNISSLQNDRPGLTMGSKLKNVPSLATMTKGALQILSQDKDGFFLMVEGGSVDHAAHANNLPRLIEEHIAFNVAVETVVDWVENNSSWDDTLVMVTTDHDNGLLLGPNADDEPYQQIISQGAGALPLVSWNSDTHTNELVPLYAMGAGSEFFTSIAKPAPGLAVYEVAEDSREYIDNTNIFDASMNAMGLSEDSK